MKRRLVVLLAVLAMFAVSAAPVGARGHAPENFRTHLTGDAEVPAVETQAQGQAIFQLRGDALHYKLIVANIENVFMAHIHMAPAGQNGPVVVWLFPEDGPPAADIDGGPVQGVIAEGIITSDDLAGPLAGQDLDDLLAEMRSGNTYVNVHTNSGVPSGEIRGQIR